MQLDASTVTAYTTVVLGRGSEPREDCCALRPAYPGAYADRDQAVGAGTLRPNQHDHRDPDAWLAAGVFYFPLVFVDLITHGVDAVASRLPSGALGPGLKAEPRRVAFGRAVPVAGQAVACRAGSGRLLATFVSRRPALVTLWKASTDDCDFRC